MKKSASTSLLVFAAALSGAYASPANRFPIKRVKSSGARISANTGPVPSFSVGSAGAGGIANVGDNLYTLDITICSQVITVQLDTGSTGESLVRLVFDIC